MQRLKMKERMLLTLYSENFSYKEISEISGVKMTSVGKSIARGLEKLRIILENEKDKMSY
jgi:DNA-directed RNA polymerase specialized sigma24 family protein